MMHKIGDCCQWTFRLMEGPNRNMNILFIIIGIIGAGYWLSQQTKYNAEAEKNGTPK